MSFPSSIFVDFDNESEVDSCLSLDSLEEFDMTALPDTIISSIDIQLSRIELDLKRVHLLARAYQHPFFDEIVERRKANEKGTGLGVRVRRKDSATEISYYHSGFWIPHGKGKILKSTFIKKSRKFSYIAKDLSALQSWEKELVLEFEKSFSYYRKLSQRLVAARKALREAKNAAKDSLIY